MKILITTENMGGVWTYSLILAKGLKKSGVDVALAIIGNPLTISQKNELDSLTWYFIASKQEWMVAPWEDISRAGKWLMKLKKMVRPDIVHLNSFSYGALPWDIPVLITAHSCVLSWWEAVKKGPLPDEFFQYEEHILKGIRAADVVVAPSCTMLKAIEKFCKPLKSKKVIYNGADSSKYYSDTKENYIFCMGRLWDEAKNINLVIEAASEIHYPIYIAGQMESTGTHRVSKNVFFIGQIPQDEVACWLAKAAIYLLPVKYEPFGYTFLEAAYSGCAIVTGRIPSMKEIWKSSCIYADIDNSTELANTINSLMTDMGKRQQLAEKARKRALSRYKFEKMTSEYILLYRRMHNIKAKRNLKLQEL